MTSHKNKEQQRGVTQNKARSQASNKRQGSTTGYSNQGPGDGDGVRTSLSLPAFVNGKSTFDREVSKLGLPLKKPGDTGAPPLGTTPDRWPSARRVYLNLDLPRLLVPIVLRLRASLSVIDHLCAFRRLEIITHSYIRPPYPASVPLTLIPSLPPKLTPQPSSAPPTLTMTEYDFSPEAHDAHMRKMRGVASWAVQTSRATSPTMPQTKYVSSPTSYNSRSQPSSQPTSRPRTSMDGGARHTRDRSRSIDPATVPRPPSRQRANSNARPPPVRSRTYSYTVQPQQGAVIPSQMYQSGVVAPQPRRQHTVPGYGTASNTHVVTYDPRRPVVLNPQPGAQYEIMQYPYVPAAPVAAMPTPRQPPLLKRLFTMWRPSSRAASTQPENIPPRRSATQANHHHRSHSRDAGRHSGRTSRDNGRHSRRPRRNSIA
ncbi:hypothetical protein PENSPDRAFT_669550 [Peniophora sp. CONT]|nr:hypothetical protein PENSPDRAFT_669550 [Peniophora sp. CONT]